MLTDKMSGEYPISADGSDSCITSVPILGILLCVNYSKSRTQYGRLPDPMNTQRAWLLLNTDAYHVLNSYSMVTRVTSLFQDLFLLSKSLEGCVVILPVLMYIQRACIVFLLIASTDDNTTNNRSKTRVLDLFYKDMMWYNFLKCEAEFSFLF